MAQQGHSLFVKRGDKSTKYVVSGDTTVRKLKEMIAEKEEYHVEAIDLTWSGRRLEDSFTINQSSLQDGTAVQLVLVEKPITVFVKTPQETTITLEVFPSTPVRELRRLVHERTGVEPEHQRLIHGPKTLEDEQHESKKELTMADYNILTGHKDVHMLLRLPGGGEE